MLKHIPNALTLSRIALAPAFVALYLSGMPIAALAVFIAGSVTDVLDGFIARRFGCISAAGKALDPLADKITLICILLCLFAAGRIPLWLLMVLTVRELLMILGGVVLWQNRITFAADHFGKITTLLFFTAAMLLYPWHENPVLMQSGMTLMLISLACSVAAFRHYYHIFRPMLAAGRLKANQ